MSFFLYVSGLTYMIVYCIIYSVWLRLFVIFGIIPVKGQTRGITGRRGWARSGLLEPENAEKKLALYDTLQRAIWRSLSFYADQLTGKQKVKNH